MVTNRWTAITTDITARPGKSPEKDEQQNWCSDGADESERLADEDLDFEPGQRPQSTQHVRSPQFRIEWPVSRMNTSSSVARSVRKSVTFIRYSAMQRITCAHEPVAAFPIS